MTLRSNSSPRSPAMAHARKSGSTGWPRLAHAMMTTRAVLNVRRINEPGDDIAKPSFYDSASTDDAETQVETSTAFRSIGPDSSMSGK